MMYNNNAQYNTMTIHNVVQYESNVVQYESKVHIVANITTMKSFPAGWIRPAPRAASAAALMHSCHPSLRDLTRAVN
jgi:hypothetical protein